MEIRIKRINEPAHMEAICGVPSVGCAHVFFESKVCVIYIYLVRQITMMHEHFHCLGYDHPGDSILRNAFLEYERNALRKR